MNLPQQIREKLTPYTERVVEGNLDRGLLKQLLDVSVTVTSPENGSLPDRLLAAGLVVDARFGEILLGRIEAGAVPRLAELSDVRQIEVSYMAKPHPSA